MLAATDAHITHHACLLTVSRAATPPLGLAGAPTPARRSFEQRVEPRPLLAFSPNSVPRAAPSHLSLSPRGTRQDTSWKADDVTWQSQPDAGCDAGSAPCCGGAVGSWEPRPSKPSEVELTYFVKAALQKGGSRQLALHLYSPGSASSREHYYVQYGSSRRGDPASRPELVLDVLAPSSAAESSADGKGLHRGLVGTAAAFSISARGARPADWNHPSSPRRARVRARVRMLAGVALPCLVGAK